MNDNDSMFRLTYCSSSPATFIPRPGGIVYVDEPQRVMIVHAAARRRECINCGAPIGSHESRCSYCLSEPA